MLSVVVCMHMDPNSQSKPYAVPVTPFHAIVCRTSPKLLNNSHCFSTDSSVASFVPLWSLEVP